jgi:hypothetical protein
MDFSDYLRRKNAQGVYNGYNSYEIMGQSNVKVITFADVYNVNLGAVQCGSSNGYLSSTVCAPSLYSNTSR